MEGEGERDTERKERGKGQVRMNQSWKIGVVTMWQLRRVHGDKVFCFVTEYPQLVIGGKEIWSGTVTCHVLSGILVTRRLVLLWNCKTADRWIVDTVRVVCYFVFAHLTFLCVAEGSAGSAFWSVCHLWRMLKAVWPLQSATTGNSARCRAKSS